MPTHYPAKYCVNFALGRMLLSRLYFIFFSQEGIACLPACMYVFVSSVSFPPLQGLYDVKIAFVMPKVFYLKRVSKLWENTFCSFSFTGFAFLCSFY